MDARNIAVVGCGRWGQNLVRNFHKLGVLHTVCDTDCWRLAETGKPLDGVGLVREYDAVLQDDDIRGVVIATPAVTHYTLALAALVCHKDVFIEKPMAMTASQGRVLAKTADDNERVLLVGHVLEYHPAIVAMMNLVTTDYLGDLLYVYSNRLNLGRFRTEENILWSFAPHDIAVMLRLAGEMPSRVVAHGGAYIQPGIVDVTVTGLEFPSGLMGHIFVSWLHPYKEQRLVAVGRKGMVVFDDLAEDKLVVYQHKIVWEGDTPVPEQGDREAVFVSAGEPLELECRDFINCIKSRHAPWVDGMKGVQVLDVLEMCQQALDNETDR